MTKAQIRHLGNILATFLTVIIVMSCGVTKKAKWSTEHLHIKSAYVQKYIPGQQSEEIVSYLFIDVEFLDSSVVLDQALYNKHIGSVNVARLPLKINWLKGDTLTSEKLESDQAIIYYRKGKKQFKQLIQDIETKEDLYLP